MSRSRRCVGKWQREPVEFDVDPLALLGHVEVRPAAG